MDAISDKTNSWENFKTLNWLPVLGIVSLVFLYSTTISPDDLALKWATLNNSPEIWQIHSNAYRYLGALLSWSIYKVGLEYFQFLPLWIILLPIACYLCVKNFVEYAKFPSFTFPFFFLGIALHGYYSDLYFFAMAYHIYSLGFIGVAGAIWFIRKPPSLKNTLLSALCLLVTLWSYQAIAFVLLIALAFRVINTWFDESSEIKGTRPWFQDIGLCLSSMIIALILFIASTKLLGAPTPRLVSPSHIFGNIPLYLTQIYGNFIDTVYSAMIFPIWERLIIAVSIMGLFYLLIRRYVADKKSMPILPLAALIGCILISPGPFNLSGEIFWPSPRSMAATPFFHVSAVATCALLIFKDRNILLPFMSIIFTLMTVHHLTLFGNLAKQDAADAFFIADVMTELEKMETTGRVKKVSLKSTAKNISQRPYVNLDFGMADISMQWGRPAALGVASKKKYLPVPPPKAGCKEPVTENMRLERVGDIVVICTK